jgi:hypothetical protein
MTKLNFLCPDPALTFTVGKHEDRLACASTARNRRWGFKGRVIAMILLPSKTRSSQYRRVMILTRVVRLIQETRRRCEITIYQDVAGASFVDPE